MADVIGAINNEGSKDLTRPSDPASPALYRGIVIEVIHDVAIMDTSQITRLSQRIKNKSILPNIPRNSCIVKIVSGNATPKGEDGYTVCFPFFPPYLCMPIKPGEHVWVFVEDPEKAAMADHAYWISRISEPLHIDDLNFTHSDRAYTTTAKILDTKKSKTMSDETTIHRGLGFPNGNGDTDGARLTGDMDYGTIYESSIGMQSVTLEPVPRFTKRPGDLVLQGSNNTCIVLGEDRGWNAEKVTESTKADWSNATNTGASLAQLNYSKGRAPYKGNPPPAGPADPNERKFAGTIDIVVGRGRFLPEPEVEPELTACKVVTNSRMYDETDKNPVVTGRISKSLQNRMESPVEGDPDFINDSSRIYVSMNTLPDFNFGITYPKIPAPGSSNDGLDIEILKEKPDGIGQAAVVIKSDEVRIIARQDLEKNPKIQGSITLIKEGSPDNEGGEGRGIITIRPDGVIMIDGPKIVIGSGIEKANGQGAQVSIGLGANNEPMVLGQQLVDLLTEFAETLNQSMVGSVGNLGAPVQFPIYSGFYSDWITRLENIKSKVGKLL